MIDKTLLGVIRRSKAFQQNFWLLQRVMNDRKIEESDILEKVLRACNKVIHVALDVSSIIISFVMNPIVGSIKLGFRFLGFVIDKISQAIQKQYQLETEAKKDVLDACKNLGEKRQEIKRQMIETRKQLYNESKQRETELLQTKNMEQQYHKDIEKVIGSKMAEMAERANEQQLQRQQKLSEWSDKIKIESEYVDEQKTIEIAKINGRKEKNIATIKEDGGKIQQLVQKRKKIVLASIEKEFTEISEAMKGKLVEISNQFDKMVYDEWIEAQRKLNLKASELEEKIKEEEKRLNDEFNQQQYEKLWLDQGMQVISEAQKNIALDKEEEEYDKLKREMFETMISDQMTKDEEKRKLENDTLRDVAKLAEEQRREKDLAVMEQQREMAQAEEKRQKEVEQARKRWQEEAEQVAAKRKDDIEKLRAKYEAEEE